MAKWWALQRAYHVTSRVPSKRPPHPIRSLRATREQREQQRAAAEESGAAHERKSRKSRKSRETGRKETKAPENGPGCAGRRPPPLGWLGFCGARPPSLQTTRTRPCLLLLRCSAGWLLLAAALVVPLVGARRSAALALPLSPPLPSGVRRWPLALSPGAAAVLEALVPVRPCLSLSAPPVAG